MRRRLRKVPTRSRQEAITSSSVAVILAITSSSVAVIFDRLFLR